jgi:dihydroneopterin aldolase
LHIRCVLMKKHVKISFCQHFFCIIGVHPQERIEKQRIFVHVECEYTKVPEITEIVCYVALRDEVEQLLEKKFFYLEEAVDFISDKLSQKYSFLRIFIRISKTDISLENTIFSVECNAVRQE